MYETNFKFSFCESNFYNVFFFGEYNVISMSFCFKCLLSTKKLNSDRKIIKHCKSSWIIKQI